MNREPTDSDEVLELFAKYEKEYEGLLDRIAKRDETVGLLRIAKPSKIAPLRELISLLNTNIERTEEILAMIAKQIALERKADRDYRKAVEMADKIRPEFLKYIAEHRPEKLEELEAMLSGDL